MIETAEDRIAQATAKCQEARFDVAGLCRDLAPSSAREMQSKRTELWRACLKADRLLEEATKILKGAAKS